ncbi:hypothetical protein D6D12_01698 [Aureobasidium pullulans]|uniref:Nephrocystin 3-like N-terminal domain-containing protein n=1 Tax=Aureobasidium pullulans TaxID=5580 RepID=A0AB74K4Y9_AURPU|nr:hypothetical protein D6D12_01698 [Aureobasidium pullulans]THX54480.1 hypothetical protein D6D11_04131 [Aureobasidium pullulans]
MDLGTAVGVISLGIQVLQGIDYGDDIASLCTSSVALLQTLQYLQVQLDRKGSIPDDFRAHILASVYQCNDGLQRLRKRLDKIKAEPVPLDRNILKSIQRQATNQLRKATYPFKCSTLAKLRETVQDLRDNLSLALQALDLNMAGQNTRTLAKIDLRVDEVINRLDALNNSMALAYEPRHLPASKPQAMVTTKWRLVTTGEGVRVLDSSTRLDMAHWITWLWQICYVVSKKRSHPLSNTDHYSAAAIALTQQRRMASRNTLLAYHFHSFSDAETWTLGAVLRNILHQLASQSDSVCNDLTTLFKTCGSGSRRPTDGELAVLLKATLSYGAETYIFLDALDESDEKFELVELPESLQSQSLNLHLFLTSRRHVAFIDAIESGKYYEISMERGAVNQDIERYVQHQLLSDSTLRKFSSALQVKIQARLSSANGMFRWAALQLQGLKNPRLTRMGDHIIERQLDNPPKTLEGTYDRILNELDDFERREAQRLLALICFSRRPLTLPEVVDALAIDFEDPDQGPFDPSYRVKDPMAVLDYCPGLITLMHKRRANAPRWRDNPVIALAHFSVDQYLRPKPNEWRFGGLTAAHALIARTCLRYLLYFDSLDNYSKTIMREYSFLYFAARNFPYHLKLSGYDEKAMDLAWRLVNTEKALRICYQVCRPLARGPGLIHTSDFVKRRKRKQGFTFSSNAPCGLFCAVIWELQPLVEKFIQTREVSLDEVLDFESGHDVSMPRNAIEAAAYVRNFDIFVLLHEAGAQIGNSMLCVLNTHEQDHQFATTSTSFPSPAEDQEKRTRKLFLNYIIANGKVDWTSSNLLSSAVIHGEIAIIKRCLENGADPHLTRKATSLSWLSLVREGEDDIARDEISLLDIARRNNHSGIERLLMKYGA